MHSAKHSKLLMVDPFWVTAVTSSTARVYSWVIFPQLKAWKEKLNFRKAAINRLDMMISSIMDEVTKFEANEVGKLKVFPTYYLPKVLRDLIKETEEKVNEYTKWLHECRIIINFIVRSEVKNHRSLKEDWEHLGIGSLENILVDLIRLQVYQGNLIADNIRDKIYELYGKDIQKEITLPQGTRTITIGGIVDSDSFYELINRLKFFEQRVFIEMLRKSRRDLLDFLNYIKKEIKERQNKGDES